jgi:hypothetical protein
MGVNSVHNHEEFKSFFPMTKIGAEVKWSKAALVRTDVRLRDLFTRSALRSFEVTS